MPDVHHIYGPSSLKNRAICPGWMNDNFSDKSKADEGTLMHSAAETGDLSILVSDEQKKAVAQCLDYLKPFEAIALKTHKEKRVSILGGRTFGTCDRIIRRTKDGRPHVDIIDFKFGYTPVDDAEDNMQGHAYLIGAWEDVHPEAVTGTVHFLQPRIGVVDVAEFDRAKDFNRLALPIATTIDRAAHYEHTKDESMLNPTAEGCLYCGRKATCPALRKFALRSAARYAPLELVEDGHSSRITKAEDMAAMVDAARVLEGMISSVKTHAMIMAKEAGGALYDADGQPLYEIKSRAGNRKIKDLGLAMPILAKHLTDAELLSVADVSITGALKLIADKAPRGQKGKTIGLVEAELEEADALSQSEGTEYLRRTKRRKVDDTPDKPLISAF